MVIENESVAEAISSRFGLNIAEARTIVEKAVLGGETNDSFGPDRWLQERFLPNCVTIDTEGYSKMCIDALKILSNTAATDYGSSRQRDLGQLWGDMTRGYLGEMAFVLFLQKWGINAELGHDVGELEDYLPTDIHKIKTPKDSTFRDPKIKIGIKATKWNGIWFDIPGDQFSHSDVQVLVKVGVSRDHLFAFFKHLSVFKDKILNEGKRINAIDDTEAEEMYERLPSFQPILAYICGFTLKNRDYCELSYTGKKGRKHYTISGWNGPIRAGDLEKIKQRESCTEGKIKFEAIEKFSHENGYLFNTGSLLWKKEDWHKVISQL